MTIKSGRKPLSQKSRTVGTPVVPPPDFMTPMALPLDLKKEIEEQGLVPRWINAGKLYANQGYHEKGWVPYRRKLDGKMGAHEFKFGNDPDGVVRRGDCILAVKNKEQHKQHTDYLDYRAQAAKGLGKQEAEKIRQYLKDSRVEGVELEEGYEEDEQGFRPI